MVTRVRPSFQQLRARERFGALVTALVSLLNLNFWRFHVSNIAFGVICTWVYYCESRVLKLLQISSDFIHFFWLIIITDLLHYLEIHLQSCLCYKFLSYFLQKIFINATEWRYSKICAKWLVSADAIVFNVKTGLPGIFKIFCGNFIFN